MLRHLILFYRNADKNVIGDHTADRLYIMNHLKPVYFLQQKASQDHFSDLITISEERTVLNVSNLAILLHTI